MWTQTLLTLRDAVHNWMLLIALSLPIIACGDGSSGGPESDATASTDVGPPGGDGTIPRPNTPPMARFALEADAPTTPLVHVPFPSDIYRTEPGGLLDLRGFPQPRQGGLLGLFLNALQGDTRGFGTSAAMYIGFESLLDLESLPQDGAASMLDTSALVLVDVDPDSPERGRRWPVRWKYRLPPSQYLPGHTLMIRLVEGYALRPQTTYALLITTAVAQANPSFQQIISDNSEGAVWQIYAPLRAWLAETGTLAATASVFTTLDPVGEMFKARDFMHTLEPPAVLSIESQGALQGRFELFDGTYEAPRFQEGVLPYVNPGEGRMSFDEDGLPIQRGTEALRFSLSVPKNGDMPEDGWPVVLYAHGTGGDFHSFYRSKVSSVMAQNGVAVISMDQIHHGTRDNGYCDGRADPDTCVSILFFNFLIPTAARDNIRQAALDLVSLHRLAQTIEISAQTSEIGRRVKIDPNNIMFMGHSQGGLNGPLYLAIEPSVKGGVLSGAGSTIAIGVEQKTQPFDINQLVAGALGLPAGDPLDRWHPALMLLQTFSEPADSINYAHFWFEHPPEGYLPKSIFMTVGLLDQFTPPDATFALAAAGSVPIIEPVHAEIEAMQIRGLAPAGLPPYAGNVAGGQASAGLAQYEDYGHHVVFQAPSATQRYRKFLGELATRPIPKIF